MLILQLAWSHPLRRPHGCLLRRLDPLLRQPARPRRRRARRARTGQARALLHKERSHNPIKRVAWEILHSEGTAIRFIGFQNWTQWT